MTYHFISFYSFIVVASLNFDFNNVVNCVQAAAKKIKRLKRQNLCYFNEKFREKKLKTKQRFKTLTLSV